MVTTGQIRAHIADLQASINAPCNCRTRSQRRKCNRGKELLQAGINVLQWVIGENMEYEELVANLARLTPNPLRKGRIILFERKDG